MKHNLHIVLCFSPSSQVLSELCRTYPNLVTLATVNVYDEWPAKALYGVALKELHSHSLMMTDVGSMLKAGLLYKACNIDMHIYCSMLQLNPVDLTQQSISFSLLPFSGHAGSGCHCLCEDPWDCPLCFWEGSWYLGPLLPCDPL